MNNSPSNFFFLNIAFVKDKSPKQSGDIGCYRHEWVLITHSHEIGSYEPITYWTRIHSSLLLLIDYEKYVKIAVFLYYRFLYNFSFHFWYQPKKIF